MYFKNEYTIMPLDLGESDNIKFNFVKDDTELSIDLTKIPKEELKPSNKVGDLKATVILQRPHGEEVLSRFKGMKHTIPEELVELITDVSHKMSSTLKQTIRIVRWVRGLADAHNFLRNAAFMKWSPDSIAWHSVPPQIKVEVSLLFPVKKIVSDEEKKLIHDLVINEIDEPFGHELFSEAYSQKSQNPRSALVIAIAAAETAFKQFVQRTSPETSWLLENVPSPPLVKMLKKYLPELPVKRKIKGKLVFVPKDILKALEEGVEIRNKIVHGATTHIKHDTLEWVMRSVRDLLYLLDFYAGFEWAQQNINEITRMELIKAAEHI